MKLYHTSSLELRSPDVDYGRKNADFGGGFYLSDSSEFRSNFDRELTKVERYAQIEEILS